MASAELSVAVLWHMHQPDYTDALSGRAAMPWVRLHALSSYNDMLRSLEEVPEARAVFNVVPVLMQQLEGLSRGDFQDDFLDLASREPQDLSISERGQLLKSFFAFHHGRQFSELPRLAELWRIRSDLGDPLASEAVSKISDQELRDLQVGFQLAWSGRTLREHELVSRLISKGRNFTRQEKLELLQLQQEFLEGTLAAYRRAAKGGILELSCTPLSHPILPLLCDTESAWEARPNLPLPVERMQRPGDAWFQVHVALSEMERIVGVRPQGMWPAEGAISAEALQIFASAGLNWVASDQDVLAASLAGAPAPPGGHFQPFRYGGLPGPTIFFRDKGLSDRIGFVYASWSASRAAADLVGHLQRIREDLPGGRWLVPIILDGENPWESYEDHGAPFLQNFYAGVAGAPGLQWTTFGEYLAEGKTEEPVPLENVCAGSWIRNDLTTWVGHPEKNEAWNRLCSVRDWLEGRLLPDKALLKIRLPELGVCSGRDVPAPDPVVVGPQVDSDLARSWRALTAAQSSDWFWWYGDDHATVFAREFDSLFRAHLTNVYRHLGEEPDPALQQSILTEGEGPVAHPPRFPLRVELDGRVSNYFEWLDAGWYEPYGGGAMHREDSPVNRLYYGGDMDRLYLRLDPLPEAGLTGLAGLTLEVRLTDEVETGVSIRFPSGMAGAGKMDSLTDGVDGLAGVFDQIVEVAVPWSCLGLSPDDQCKFFVSLARAGDVEMVLPARGCLHLRVPLGPEDSDDWLV